MSQPNPFESPQTPIGNFSPPLPDDGSIGGWARQITIVAILLIVEGVLELLYGLYMVGMGVFMATYFENFLPPEQRNAPNAPPPAFMFGIFFVWAVFIIPPAIVKIWAGISNYNFRRRTLGIVALALGAMSCVTIYCAPTGIALMIYGLIVYLKPDSEMAFACGAQGFTGDQIRARIR